MTRRKSPTPVDQTVPFQVVVPSDLLDAFKLAAKSEDRSASAELRRLMRERVKEHEAERQDLPA